MHAWKTYYWDITKMPYFLLRNGKITLSAKSLARWKNKFTYSDGALIISWITQYFVSSCLKREEHLKVVENVLKARFKRWWLCNNYENKKATLFREGKKIWYVFLIFRASFTRKALQARKERGLLASFCVKKITGLKRFKRLEKVQ